MLVTIREQQLRGMERVIERQREKTSKTRGDYASYGTGTAAQRDGESDREIEREDQ